MQANQLSERVRHRSYSHSIGWGVRYMLQARFDKRSATSVGSKLRCTISFEISWTSDGVATIALRHLCAIIHVHYICTQCSTVTVQLEGAGWELSFENHQNIKIIPLGPLQLRIGEIIQESKSYWALYAHHIMCR